MKQADCKALKGRSLSVGDAYPDDCAGGRFSRTGGGLRAALPNGAASAQRTDLRRTIEAADPKRVDPRRVVPGLDSAWIWRRRETGARVRSPHSRRRVLAGAECERLDDRNPRGRWLASLRRRLLRFRRRIRTRDSKSRRGLVGCRVAVQSARTGNALGSAPRAQIQRASRKPQTCRALASDLTMWRGRGQLMDRIEFIGRPYRDGERDSGIQIRINGRDLVEMVRAIENPFAYKEGVASIAGAYAGLPPDEDTCPPSKHFLGEPSAALYRFGAKTQILGCECGEVGCWPLLCRIDVERTRVIWSRFEQPHRKGQSGRAPWIYGGLGPFEFHRTQYEQALAALGPRL